MTHKETDKKSVTPASRRGLWIAIAAIVVVAFLGSVALTAAVVYGGGRENAITRVVERIIPLPVVIVDRWHSVSLRELRENLDVTRSFYRQQEAEGGERVDFDSDDGRKRLKLWERTLLDKLIEDEVVMILAEREGVTVTDEQVHARVSQFLDRYGTNRVAKDNIRDIWGLTMDEFEQKIVKPQVYREMLQEVAARQVDTTKERERALSAKNELAQGGDFSEVAHKYGDNAVGDAALVAAWFRKEDLMPAVAEAAWAAQVGGVSDVIETTTGFHIISVDNRQTRLDGEQVLLRTITIMKPSFAVWLEEQLRTMSVTVLLGDYYWNTDVYHVDLRSDELRNFAEQLTTPNAPVIAPEQQ